jgi:polar amino acid transport system permease protein
MDVFRRVVLNNLDALLGGLWVTVQVSAIAFVLALLLGFAAALVRLYVRPARYLAETYIQFCRNTPIFVQLMWVAYVWPDVVGWPRSFFAAGFTALALQSSGYLAETFRSGIQGMDRGQRESAYSLGMPPLLTMRRIILPQVLLLMSPAIMNQFLVVVKSSTLVSVIAVPDLMYHALRLTRVWLEPIEILSVTAFLYIAMVFVLSTLIKWHTDRMRARFG